MKKFQKYSFFAADLVRKRMNSLRTIFGKLLQKNPERMSDREKDILDLCDFLKDFMRCTRGHKAFGSAKEKPNLDETKQTVSSEKEKLNQDEDESDEEKEKEVTQNQTEPQEEKNKCLEKETDHEQADVTCFRAQANVHISDSEKVSLTDVLHELFEYFKFSRQEFNVHESWARCLAEKIKCFDPLKAERIKLRIDTLVVDDLEELFVSSEVSQQCV